MFPERIKVPEPDLIKLPLVTAVTPDIVRVLPGALTSMVLVVPAPRVNARSVLAVMPVYCRVPPFRTRLAAELVAWPKLPAKPPLLMDGMLRVPALIVVMPV